MDTDTDTAHGPADSIALRVDGVEAGHTPRAPSLPVAERHHLPRGHAQRTRTALVTLPLLLGVAATGCSSGGSDTTTAQPSTSTGSSTGTATTCPTPDAEANAKNTASYRMVVSSSGPEAMLTQAQVDAQGLTEGELVMGGGMPMGSPGAAEANGHVEVAVCDLATGETVSGAEVSMQLVSGGDTRTMRVMEMRGLDEPATQSHYGNNTMVPERAYDMRVTLNGESAQFAMPAMGEGLAGSRG